LAGSSEDTSEDTVTYELRIWIDENAPISEQNKTFQSKISVTIGQGVINPYKEGTLAYDILSNYGGADAITSLSAEWTEGDASTVTASSQNLGTSNSYWYGTTYKFDKKTGKYTLSGTLTQATLEECRNGTKTCGNYTLRDAEKNYSAKRLFQITEFGTEGNNVTAKILSSYNMFSKDLTSYDAGLYKAQDDLGETFIFRGNVTNNYVKFGTYAKDTTVTVYDTVNSIRKEIPILEESPMYWRIVRINGDGTIRMIYDGIEKIENSNVNSFASIGLGMFIDYSLDSNDEKYVGYTYDENGIQTKVLVKNILDLWYSNNIKGRFDNWVSDGIFCNDKSAKYQYLDDYYHETTPELSTTRKIFFETQNRKENFSPSLKCENKSDRYAVSDKLGNGYFEYSVGLITMDEVQIIGPSSYLYTNTRFWTASPAHNNYGLYMYTLDPTYGLSQDYVRNEINVRPVINLKANVKFTGDGSYGTPYEIVMN
ncbi:MAG: hypothetical protein IJN03_02350, partial [Bacilli bacterium]|nr:hypothetical protein [Bacilli bacterium]